MGAVYRARDTENNREVALKVLSPDLAERPFLLERFRREARHALKLRHDNIVTLYEFSAINGLYLLAMEFVEGVDLHEHVNRHGVLDPEEARDVILQACRALHHAFVQNIVHRDIKPSNFMVASKNGRLHVKLTDLGLAFDPDLDDLRLTRVGTTVGTIDYMAPEQACDSGAADIRSDLYSLGATWFHLLAGRAPFGKGKQVERLDQLLNTPAPDVRKFNPRVSRETWAILSKLLAKDPEERYQTPAELIADLLLLEGRASVRRPKKDETLPVAAALRQTDTICDLPAAPAQSAGPKRGRLRLALLGGGVLLAAVAILLSVLVRKP
jgi:serine/threonine-protein kinase